MRSPSGFDYASDDYYDFQSGNTNSIYGLPMISPLEPSFSSSKAIHGTRNQWTRDDSDRALAAHPRGKLTHQDVFPQASKDIAQDRRVGVDLLAEYRKRLKSKSCAACKTPVEIDAADLVKKTGKMLKESRKLAILSPRADRS